MPPGTDQPFPPDMTPTNPLPTPSQDPLEPHPLNPDKSASATPKENLGFGSMDRPANISADPSPMSEVGVSGLSQAAGYILEEKLRQLQGSGINNQAFLRFREMADNDATVSSILFILQMMVRKVDWRTEPYSQEPEDIEAQEFLDSVFEDNNTPFEDVIMDIITMFVFGFSILEIVYKRRLGPDNEDPNCRSAYNDGLMGWKKLAGRAQESIANWVFDQDGEVLGCWQWPPFSGQKVFLPREKMLMFRTTKVKDNPEGKSMLRGAYTAYYRKTNMERIEAIGIERDLAGLPVLYVDPDILASDATPDLVAIRNEYKRILANIRMDQQTGVLLPAHYDEKGNKQTELTLLGTGSRRQNNTDGIIKRYAADIATVIIADFILLGHEGVGSFALAEQKYDMFVISLGAFMDSIASVFNRDGIVKLFKINGFPTDRLPKLVPGVLEKQDLSEISLSLMQLLNSKALVLGGLDDENWIRKMLGMPPRTEPPPVPGDGTAPDDSNYLAHEDMVPPIPIDPNKAPNPAGQSAGSGATPTGGVNKRVSELEDDDVVLTQKMADKRGLKRSRQLRYSDGD